MSDSNRERLSYIAESSFGVTPSGALQEIRFTSESLKQETSTTISQEIRDDRQIPDVIRTSLRTSGDINAEFSYGAFDDFLASVLMSAGWSSIITVTATTISAASADNSFNDSGSGFGSVVAGQWIKVSGFATAGNNGFFKVVTKTTGKLVVEGGTLTNESATPSVTVRMGAYIENGTTQSSYSIERRYSDLSGVFSAFVGQMLNTFNVAVPTEGIVTCAFGFIGKTEASAGATIGTSYTAQASGVVFNSIEHVTNIKENMADLSITAFNMALNNNLRHRGQVGTLGPVSVGSGAVNITGNVSSYFATATMIDKYLNFTSSRLAVRFTDAAGQTYILELPQVKYTSGERVAGGQNQDIIANMNFTAYRDIAENCTIRIARFA